MSFDVLGDFLTIIRNGTMASKPTVLVPHSKLKAEVARILKDEGFIRDFVVLDGESHKQIKILLKYVDGESVIHAITRMSTPGRRVYARAGSIKPVIGGLGISILTTNRGVVTHKQAKELGVGGEVICSVW